MPSDAAMPDVRVIDVVVVVVCRGRGRLRSMPVATSIYTVPQPLALRALNYSHGLQGAGKQSISLHSTFAFMYNFIHLPIMVEREKIKANKPQK